MAESWLHEAVCRQRPELCPIFVSSFLTVFEAKVALFRTVNDERWKSNLSLYCTVVYCTVAPVVQQSIAVPHSIQCHCSMGSTAIYFCTVH